jgi:TldD protein
MIRMVNVSLEPRQGSFEDLIADTADGLLFDTNKSWSIDDLRLNFQFSCELVWEIKHGKRARLFRDARYTGVTPEFWSRCDAICGPEEARIWGLSTCGKGDPIQSMQVAHGAPPARFRRIEVGHS